MKLVWYCYKCKKKVEKKPKQIGNTFYIPEMVLHKHGKIRYQLHCMTFEEFMRNPKFKGY